MTTKHTPETWKPIRDIGSGKINIWADDGNEWIGEVEDMSDARLIAAAPDLLEACEHVRDTIREFLPTVMSEDLTAIEAAIAKAKGETK